MLTDIFAYRYLDTLMWENFDENARRLLVQGFRIVSEQLYPYFDSDGKVKFGAKETWGGLNKQLAMELGLKDLSSPFHGHWTTWQGSKRWISSARAEVTVCENFVCAEFDGKVSADQFIKERLSFIEIAFRKEEEEIAKINTESPSALADALKRSAKKPSNRTFHEMFRSSCRELNERFRQARTKLHYPPVAG